MGCLVKSGRIQKGEGKSWAEGLVGVTTKAEGQPEAFLAPGHLKRCCVSISVVSLGLTGLLFEPGGK